MDKVNVRIVLEAIIILILSGAYLLYSYGDKITHIFHKSEPFEVTEINNLILEAVNNLENNQYENAVRKYNDIKIKFSGIEQEYKAELKSEIIVLCHKIDISYITMLVKEANYHLISSNKEKAAS